MLAPNGTHISINQMFPSYQNDGPMELTLDPQGGLTAEQGEAGKSFCDAILNGALTMEQAINILAKAAAKKTNGNLSAAARMLGLSRAQLAYRLENCDNDNNTKPRPKSKSNPGDIPD